MLSFIQENWPAILLGLSLFANVLQAVAARTKNKVDDAVADVIAEGVSKLPKDPPKLK